MTDHVAPGARGVLDAPARTGTARPAVGGREPLARGLLVVAVAALVVVVVAVAVEVGLDGLRQLVSRWTLTAGLVATVALAVAAAAWVARAAVLRPRPLRDDLPMALAVVAYAALAVLVFGGHLGPAIEDATGTGRPHRAAAVLFAVASVALTAVIAVRFVAPAGPHEPAGQPGTTTLPGLLDPRRATSSTVILCWTFVVVYALAFLSALSALSGVDCGVELSSCIAEGAWSDYLIVLGGPAAAAAVAHRTSTSTSTSSSTAPVDESRDDSRIISVQYYAFNALAIVYVVVRLVQDDVLPGVPPLLLALTGASAAGYALTRSTPA